MDAIIGLIRPLMEGIGIPGEVLPLALLRPITGAGSLAFVTDLIKEHGPDSLRRANRLYDSRKHGHDALCVDGLFRRRSAFEIPDMR